LKRQSPQTEHQLARKLIALANQPKFRSGSGSNAIEVQYADGKRITIPRPGARSNGAATINSYR
jgi:hypothetical protein